MRDAVCRPQDLPVLIAATALLVFAIPAAADHHEEARHPATATVTIQLPAPVERVFRLFDPLNRGRWDADWEIEMPDLGDRRQSRTGDRFHRISDPGSMWTVVTLDHDAHRIELAYEKPKLYDMQVRIDCEATSPEVTTTSITYRAIGQDDHVHEALSLQLAHQIEELIKGDEGWERKINHFLEHGTRLAVFEPLAIERSHSIELSATPVRSSCSRRRVARPMHGAAPRSP